MNDSDYIIRGKLPTISIIIPTHNRARFVGDTIQSFIDQDYPKDKYEIIVVDNGSKDNTKEVVSEYLGNPTVAISYSFEKSIGTIYARNRAAKTAKNEILYLVDDDVIADKSLLMEIVKPFIIDSRVATATGRVLPRWEEEPPAWVKKFCNNRFLSLLDPPEDFIISKSINYLYSCHQAVRKDVFFEVGGFNPESFGSVYLGDGETGLNTKIRQKGYLFGYNGKSVTYHVMPATRYTQAYLNRRLSNSGFAQAFTDFRRYGASHIAILIMILRATLLFMPIIYLTNIINLLRYRDANLGRFFIAYTYYYKSFIKYCYWLVTDRQWRKYTIKSDWLNNDSAFIKEITSRP